VGERVDGVGGLVAGEQRGNDLDQREHRDRVEEVEPDDVVRPARGHGQLHDRDGRRVGRQHRVVGLDGGVELPEHPELDVLSLGHGLHDQLAVGELAEVGHEAQTTVHRTGRRLVELAPLHRLGQRALDALAPGGQRPRVGLGHEDVTPGPSRHLGDARPHQPTPHDTDLLKRHAARLVLVRTSLFVTER
jgi:hypothetical protein